MRRILLRRCTVAQPRFACLVEEGFRSQCWNIRFRRFRVANERAGVLAAAAGRVDRLNAVGGSGLVVL